MTVLLFGCPRSGTSILGELFEHVPEYQFYFEPSMTSVKRLDFESWTWAIKNPIGPDPTPGLACNLKDLLASVPDPVAVFIVRHPLDTICSLQHGLSNGWNHGPVPPAAVDLQRPLDRAAALWSWVNKEGFSALPSPYLVRFERLVSDPIAESLAILRHVGSSASAEDIRPYTRLLSARTGGYEAKHQDRWVTDDHESRIGRWQTMQPEDASRCWAQVKTTAERFGYSM